MTGGSKYDTRRLSRDDKIWQRNCNNRKCQRSAMKTKHQRFKRRSIFNEIILEKNDFLSEYDSQDDREDFIMEYPEEEYPDIASMINYDDGASESGLSYDNRSIILNSVCQRLLSKCDRDYAKYIAIITTSLIQEETPELFINAEVSTSTIGIVALSEYTYQAGDLHDAISAILAWIKEEREHEKPNMKYWCQQHGIRANSLNIILKSIENLKYNWNVNDGDLMMAIEFVKEHYTSFLVNAFGEDLCYYLGHPDLGYKNLRSGEVISCCPASSLRLLNQMPDFIISCKHRHTHVGRQSQSCHYMVVLDEVTGTNLALALDSSFFDQIIDVDRVSEVEGISHCSRYTREILQQMWMVGDREESLKNKLHVLCCNSPVLMDIVPEIKIKFYALKEHHKRVRIFINDELDKIRQRLSSVQRIVRFQNERLNIRLLMSSGAHCKDVYVPGDPVHGPSDKMFKNGYAYRMSREVLVNIETDLSIIEEQQQNIGRYRSNDFLSFLNYLLSYISETQWYVKEIDINNNLAKAQLVFVNPGAAHGALYLLNDNKFVRIQDEKAIESQCKKMTLHLDGRVFSVIGDLLIEKLNSFCKSSNYCSSYEVEAHSKNKVVIEVVATSEGTCDEIAEKIKNIIEPSTVRRDIDEDQDGFVLAGLIIGRQTGTWLRIIKKHSIQIFGEPKSKRRALALLRTYGSGGTKKVWQFIEQTRPFTDALPPDPVLYFHNGGSNILVDMSKKTIQTHLHSTETVVKKLPLSYFYFLTRGEHDVLLPDYASEFLPSSSKQQSICVVCWEETTAFYTLELCSHQCCYDCINIQMKVALNENKLPLSCASCDVLFTIIDVLNLAKCRLVPDYNLDKVYYLALNQFIIDQSTKYGFCPRPGCSGIFRKTTRTAMGLICIKCKGKVCDTCHDLVHDGIDCQEYKEMVSWMEADPELRKRCPKCLICIEKVGGCLNVRCDNCWTNICWKCLIYNSNADHIYKHIHYNHQ